MKKNNPYTPASHFCSQKQNYTKLNYSKMVDSTNIAQQYYSEKEISRHNCKENLESGFTYIDKVVMQHRYRCLLASTLTHNQLRLEYHRFCGEDCIFSNTL